MRKKADGTAFEAEFRQALETKYYVKRLPTLNTGFSGLRQPADFMLVGDYFNYVEVKETTDDAFSITSMQQYDLMKEFYEEKEKILEREGVVGIFGMEYWILVHFLAQGKYVLISGQDAIELSSHRKRLTCKTPIARVYDSLEELKEDISW